MKYVLDSSVALQWVLNEASSVNARRLRAEYRNKVHDLLAPDTFIVEIGHALTKAERRSVIQVGDAASLLADILLTTPRLESYLPLIHRAVEISSLARIGVYDCLFVALAEQEGCELVTADQKLLKSLPQFPIRDITMLP